MSETKRPELGPRPEWAEAVIVAEREVDKSELMTDYFATSTEQFVPLAWSRHTRDVFSEMRKAAARFEPTAHLGPGKGHFTARVVFANEVVDHGTAYWAGTPSHWHGGPATFETRAEAEAFIESAGAPEPIYFGETKGEFRWEITERSLEHREKYSMGHGYYLKASGRYSSGWVVRKSSYRLPAVGERFEREAR